MIEYKKKLKGHYNKNMKFIKSKFNESIKSKRVNEGSRLSESLEDIADGLERDLGDNVAPLNVDGNSMYVFDNEIELCFDKKSNHYDALSYLHKNPKYNKFNITEENGCIYLRESLNRRVNESLESDLYSAGIDYDYLDEDNGLTAIVVHNGQDYFSKVNEIAEKNRRYDGVQLMRNALTYYNTYITDEDKKKYDWSSSSRDLFIDLDKYDEVDESVKVNEAVAKDLKIGDQLFNEDNPEEKWTIVDINNNSGLGRDKDHKFLTITFDDGAKIDYEYDEEVNLVKVNESIAKSKKFKTKSKVNESFAYIYDKKRRLYYNPYYEDMWRNNYDQANIVDISVAESDLKKLRSGDYNNLLLSDQDPYNDLTYVIVDESVNCRIYKGVRIKESVI